MSSPQYKKFHNILYLWVFYVRYCIKLYYFFQKTITVFVEILRLLYVFPLVFCITSFFWVKNERLFLKVFILIQPCKVLVRIILLQPVTLLQEAYKFNTAYRFEARNTYILFPLDFMLLSKKLTGRPQPYIYIYIYIIRSFNLSIIQ